MKCPYCGSSDSEVVETRDGEAALRRRRECKKCSKRYTTYERIENVDLMIIKKDGRREKFEREKLRRGLVRAVEKRPISTDLIESIIDEIEQDLRNRDTTEICSKTIGDIALKRLKKIDKVAYVRFASVYMDFENLEDFVKVIDKLS